MVITWVIFWSVATALFIAMFVSMGITVWQADSGLDRVIGISFFSIMGMLGLLLLGGLIAAPWLPSP